jgi:hypothetical protein
MSSSSTSLLLKTFENDPLKSLHKHLNVNDKLTLATFLYGHKFKNEYYRLRSLELILELSPFSEQFASRGFYFAGKKGKRKRKAILVCAFCSFQMLISLTGRFNGNFKEMDEHHERVRTENCLRKLNNVPVHTTLQTLKLYRPGLSMFPMMDIAKSTALPESSLKDNDTRCTLCPVCMVRELEVIVFPCGEIISCFKCFKDCVPHNQCTYCSKEIESYAKIFLS